MFDANAVNLNAFPTDINIYTYICCTFNCSSNDIYYVNSDTLFFFFSNFTPLSLELPLKCQSVPTFIPFSHVEGKKIARNNAHICCKSC